MLKPLVQFFRQHRVYRSLLFLVLVVYGILWAAGAFREEAPAHAPKAVQAYEHAEKAFEEKIRSAGDLSRYLEKNPALARQFEIVTSAIAIFLLIGTLFDVLLIFQPRWRFPVPPPAGCGTFAWNFWMLLKFSILFFSVSLLTSACTLAIRKWVLPGMSDNFHILLDTTLMDISCLLIIFYLVREEKGTWSELGLWIPGGKLLREVFYGIAGYFAALPAFMIVMVTAVLLAEFFHYEPPAHPLVNIFLEEAARSPLLLGFSIFLACVIGPFFEEVFFRGFCYPIIREKYGAGIAMVVTASLFAFIHESTFAFWPIFVLGLALAYVYEKRRNLIAPWVLHMVHNSLFIAYFFLMKAIVLKEGG